MIHLRKPANRFPAPLMLAIFGAQTALAGFLLAAHKPAETSLVYSGMLGLLAAATLVLAILAVFTHTRRGKLEAFYEGLPRSSQARRWLNVLLCACFMLSIGFVFGISLIEGYAQSYPGSPIAFSAGWMVIPGLFFAAILFEAGIWTATTFHGDSGGTVPASRHKTEIAFLILVGILALGIGLSGLGVRGQSTLFYGFPGAPVMEWQVGLVFALGGGMAFLQAFSKDPTRPRRLDGWFFGLIWAGSLLIWMSQPINTGGYALPPRAPNYAVYPFSDAMSYDRLARSVAAGFGFMDTQIPPRPLYITFLAALHGLAGQDYPVLIALQSVLLALLPASLYLLGKDTAGRPAGLALAALVVFRDVNSNTAEAFASNLSYSKMLLSELPTALLLVVFAWILLRWARRGQPALLEAFLAGGLVGLAVLIRTQSLAAVPVGLLILLLNRPRAWRSWLRGALALMLGLSLAISPWLVRNLQIGGGLVFDDPVSQTMVLAQRYNGIAYNAMIPRQPGESDSRYTARLMSLALDGLRRNPTGIASAAAAHLVNSLADSLRILPVRVTLSRPLELAKPAAPFWETALDTFAPAQVALLLVILALCALGAADCWRRAGWAGLLPLGLNLAYNAWSALFFASGERFILPVDWAVLLYFSSGLLSAGGALAAALHSNSPKWHNWVNGLINPSLPEPPAVQESKWWQVGLAGLLCLGLGSSIPLAEHWIQPSAALQAPTRNDLLARLESGGLDSAALEKQAGQDGALILHGLSAYPLYYGAGEGYPGIEKTGYAPSPQPRLVFFILARHETFALMDLPQAPDFFPDGAEITAIGRQEQGYVAILAALVQKDGRQALWTVPGWETSP